MQLTTAISPSPASDFRMFVEKRSGQKIFHCYQCGKCSAGCPSAHFMDMGGPRKIMRSIQLGLKEEVLAGNTIWLCVSCETCSARCPANIDIARVMESLRCLAAEEKIKPAEKDIELFHRMFLLLNRRFGRVPELWLGALYNMLGKHPFANMSLVPGMFSRGKLAIMPPRIKGASEVKRLFDKVKSIEGKSSMG